MISRVNGNIQSIYTRTRQEFQDNFHRVTYEGSAKIFATNKTKQHDLEFQQNSSNF